jgi:hypothetical protein
MKLDELSTIVALLVAPSVASERLVEIFGGEGPARRCPSTSKQHRAGVVAGLRLWEETHVRSFA